VKATGFVTTGHASVTQAGMGKGVGLGPARTTVPTWVIASTAAVTASRATLVQIAPSERAPVNVPATENALTLRANVTKGFLATTAR